MEGTKRNILQTIRTNCICLLNNKFNFRLTINVCLRKYIEMCSKIRPIFIFIKTCVGFERNKNSQLNSLKTIKHDSGAGFGLKITENPN